MNIAGKSLSENLPLVFLHGFLGSREDWKNVAAAPEFSGRAYLLDLPGHGEAPLPEGPLSLESMARFVVDFLDKEGLSSVILVGYSMGGRIALSLALQYPQRVRALVLESASPGIGDPVEREQRRTKDRKRATFLRARGLTEFLENWYGLPLFASLRAHEDFEDILHRRRRGDAAALARVIEELSPGSVPDLWGRLSGLTMPTLLLAGGKDGKYVDVVRRAGERIPDAEVAIVENCGHNIHLEAPEYFVSLLDSFLAGLG